MNIKRLLYSKYSNIIISIILGLGLSTLFRKACNSRNCLVFRAPPFDKIVGKTFKHDDKCYSYKPSTVTCDPLKKVVEFE